MTEFRQPRNRFDFGEFEIRIQILDPVTAFELEREIVNALGETLALTLAAPAELTGAVWRNVTAASGETRSFAEVLADSDPGLGLDLAARGVRALATTLADAVIESTVDGRWVAGLWRKIVIGRVYVDAKKIETMRDWTRLGLRPLAKWHVLAAQIRQTYGPLWVRSPYSVRSTSKDYGVKPPPGVPVASQWAAMLASQGIGTVTEIEREWTPVQMIEQVETAAFMAERERRAVEAARAEAGR